MPDRKPRPVPPTLVPVLFLSCATLLVLAYLALGYLGYPPGYALVLSPLLLPLFPAEIRYSLARRRVCADIITDFVTANPQVDTDYDRIIAGMRRPGLAVQTVTAGDDSSDPLTWH